MQAREFLFAIVAVGGIAAISGAVLLLARWFRSERAAPRYPGAGNDDGVRATAPSGDTWLVAKNNQQFGPITFDQLRAFAHDGLLRRTDPLKRTGSQTWIRAGEVRELFSSPPPLATASTGRGAADFALSVHD